VLLAFLTFCRSQGLIPLLNPSPPPPMVVRSVPAPIFYISPKINMYFIYEGMT
jgi:hypothetical protein